MTKFTLVKQELTQKDIDTFQEEMNLKLPKSYIEHMLKFNGGAPDDNYFKGSVGIAHFDPIKYGNYPLEKKIKMINDVLPKDFFPFAYDAGGNDFCIDLSEENNGKVYFIDWDEPDDPEFLANSFEEFLEGLTDTKEDF